MEVSAYPQRREADRIWDCLDYVFVCDARLPREEKARIILTDIKEKSAIFYSLRKIQVPTVLQQKIDSGPPLRMLGLVTEKGVDGGPHQEIPPDMPPVNVGTFAPQQPIHQQPSSMGSINNPHFVPDALLVGAGNDTGLWGMTPQQPHHSPPIQSSPTASSEYSRGSGSGSVSADPVPFKGPGVNAGQTGIADMMADIDWVSFLNQSPAKC
jgi:hypothetical protein